MGLSAILLCSCEKEEIGDFYIAITNTYDFAIAVEMDGVDLSRRELTPGQSSYGNAAPGRYTVSATVTGDDYNNEFSSNSSVTENFIENGNYGWIAGEPQINYYGDVTEPADPIDPDTGGGGSGNCADLTYNGPTEGQIMQFCKAAQLYDCEGATTEKAYVCEILASYGASCQYCN